MCTVALQYDFVDAQHRCLLEHTSVTDTTSYIVRSCANEVQVFVACTVDAVHPSVCEPPQLVAKHSILKVLPVYLRSYRAMVAHVVQLR